MMAADYRHIGGHENRLGRHYSRFSPFWPVPALAGQSLALRKLCDAGSNRRSRAKPKELRSNDRRVSLAIRFLPFLAAMSSPPAPCEFVFRCNLRRSIGGLKGLTPKSAAADMADAIHS